MNCLGEENFKCNNCKSSVCIYIPTYQNSGTKSYKVLVSK